MTDIFKLAGGLLLRYLFVLAGLACEVFGQVAQRVGWSAAAAWLLWGADSCWDAALEAWE